VTGARAAGVVPPPGTRLATVDRAVSPRIAALAPGSATDEWWSSVGDGPLCEPDPDDPAYRIVTFLWRDRHGTGAGTRAVLVSINKVTDRYDPASGRLDRITGTDVWAASWRLRADWRGSYRMAADDGDPLPADGYWSALAARGGPDPRNPVRLPARWGDGGELSVGALPDAPAESWWHRRPGVPAGRLTRYDHDGRPVFVYTPPGHRAGSGPYPVLVLLDGEMWGERLPVTATLDNLIADGRVPPLVAVLPSAVDLPTRRRELACSDAFVAWLSRTLLPWAARRFGATDDPARTVVAGQSLGGLTAAYAGFRAPDRFGAAICQSGSFWWPSGTPYDTGASWLTRQYATHPRRPIRLYLSAGVLERPTHVRHLRDVLDARGYDATYTEYFGGHDYAWWRGDLGTALATVAGDWPAGTGIMEG